MIGLIRSYDEWVCAMHEFLEPGKRLHGMHVARGFPLRRFQPFAPAKNFHALKLARV